MSDHDSNSILSWPVVVQRIAIGAATAVALGGGAMLIGDNTKVQLHEQRLAKMEENIGHLPDIDKNVLILSGKLDVLSSKLDDAQARSIAVGVARATPMNALPVKK